MAPLLIDSRDLLKLVLISMLLALLVFVSGFFVGINRADVFYQSGNTVVQPLKLPAYIDAGDVADAHVPENVVAGEDIDVDQPDSVIETAAEELAGTSVNDAMRTSYNSAVTPASGSDTAISQEAVEQPVLERKDTGQTARLTSDEAGEIKYSVQVGMYGRLRNAENMMKALQAKKYDAYISDYTNGKNETRYNVRFGYFADRKSAVSSLETFRRGGRNDGYLVRFSADNIVTVARTAGDSRNMAASQPGEHPENEPAPVLSAPEEHSSDKISQADVLNEARIKAN